VGFIHTQKSPRDIAKKWLHTNNEIKCTTHRFYLAIIRKNWTAVGKSFISKQPFQKQQQMHHKHTWFSVCLSFFLINTKHDLMLTLSLSRISYVVMRALNFNRFVLGWLHSYSRIWKKINCTVTSSC
jgi:hypothetical protein